MLRLKPENPLMQYENIEYLVEKKVPEVLAEMLTYLQQKSADSAKQGSVSSVIGNAIAFLNEKIKCQGQALPRKSKFPGITRALSKKSAPKAAIKVEEGPMVNLDCASTVASLHQQLQAVLSINADSPAKLQQKFSRITNLIESFKNNVLYLSTSVIEEKIESRPQTFCTFDGDVCLQDGLAFRFTDYINLPNSDAMKLLSQECKAIGAVLGANVADVHVPLAMQVRHLGQAVWVETQLPLQKDSMVYGYTTVYAVDGKPKDQLHIKKYPEMSALVKHVCEGMNLKNHIGNKRGSKPQFSYGPVELQGHHCFNEGNFYLLELKKMFPVMPVDMELNPSHRIRPEAVWLSQYPLNSNACESDSASVTRDDDEVWSVSGLVLQQQVPKVAQRLLYMGGLLTPASLKQALHQHGVNLRWLGRVLNSALELERVSPQSAGGRRSPILPVLCVEMVARAFRVILEDAWFSISLRKLQLPEYEAKASELFHKLLSPRDEAGKLSDEHDRFWAEVLLPQLKTKFGEVRVAFSPDLVPRNALFQRCCELTGVRFAMASWATFEEFAGKTTVLPAPKDVAIFATAKIPKIICHEAVQLVLEDQLEAAWKMLDAIINLVDEVNNPGLVPPVALMRLLAMVYRTLGRPDQLVLAESCLQRIVMLREMDGNRPRDAGSLDCCYLDDMTALAEFYIYQRLYNKALDVLLKVTKRAEAVCGGPHSLRIARAHQSLSSIYFLQGEIKLSLDTFKSEVLPRFERFYGRGHPATASCLAHLGLFYARQDLHENAMTHYVEALDILLKIFGNNFDNPDTCRVGFHLAVSNYFLGRYNDAYDLFRKCLSGLRQSFGAADSMTLSCAAYISILTKQNPQTTSLIHDELLRKQEEEDQMAYISKDQPLLKKLLDSRQYAEALPLFQSFVDAQEKKLGTKTSVFIRHLLRLARAYQDAGRGDESAVLLLRALAINESLYGARHIYVADNLREVSRAYEALGRTQEAVEYYAKALEVYAPLISHEPVAWATFLQKHADMLQKNSQFSESLLVWKKILTLRAQTLGESDPTTVETRAYCDQLAQYVSGGVVRAPNRNS